MIMKDLEKLRKKRNQEVEEIKQNSLKEIDKIKTASKEKLGLGEMSFLEKRAKHQKGEGRLL